ncbi:MAG: hypothetical protein AAF986_01000 [Pseudomonadota bacterium]
MVWDGALARLCFLCIGAALVAFFITGVAARSGLMGDAVTHRSNHTGRPSRAGGFIIFLLTAGLSIMATMAGGPTPPAFVTLAVCAAVLGLVDDVTTMVALPKLLVLLLISILTAVIVGPLPPIPIPFWGSLMVPAVLGYPLAVFFLLGFVNAFNFMDGLNGISGAVGIVALFLLLFVSSGGQAGFAFFVLLFASVLYGFLVRNVMTGKVFLGDAGSLGIGLFLSASALWLGQGPDQGVYKGVGQRPQSVHPYAFYIFVIAFIPYLADTTATLFRRWRAGSSLFEAHKEHFYQQMRALGWSHQAVAAVYAGLTLAGGGAAWGASVAFGALGLWGAGIVAVAAYAGVVWVMVCRCYDRRITERLASSSSSDRNGPDGTTDRASAASLA